MRWPGARGVDALSHGCVILRLCVVNAWNKFLRIAIDQWEPRGLHLDHNAMSFEENMVVAAQRDREFFGMIWCEGLRMFVAAIVASAADFHCDWQFVSVKRFCIFAGNRAVLQFPRVRLSGFRVHVDELDHEIAIRAGRRGEYAKS